MRDIVPLFMPLPSFCSGVAAVAAMLYFFSQSGYKEISYKDFLNTYSMDKSVERLEVVNKKWVRVKLTNRSVRLSGRCNQFSIV